MDKEKQCLEYFSQSYLWERILRGFMEKYYSYGAFSGTVKLNNLTEQDIEEMEGFFGKNYHGHKSATISAESFRKALSDSCYAFMTPEYLLELYFGEKPVGKKEKQENNKILFEKVAQELKVQFQDTPAISMFEEIEKIVRYDEKSDISLWKEKMQLAVKIINGMPYRTEEKMYLAVFATKITGNPHAFDIGTPGGKLLYQLVTMDLEKRNIVLEASPIFPAYRRQKSYLYAGILIDDISNYTMFCGIKARKKDGINHEGINGFFKEKDIIQLSLSNLVDLKEIICPKNTLYIVENPSVFALLCEKNDGKQAYMCMNGQPKLAALIALELCAGAGTRVYYAGDFDPEGLLIAQKLAYFYEGEYNYWHMDKENYLTCKSNEKISSKRMKMLEKITDKRLLPLVEEIKKHGVAGYQEGWL